MARFWKYVQKAGPDECWWWIGGRHHSMSNDFEYGSLAWPTGTSAMVMAHRVCWEIHHGSTPDDLLVCHACDHPLCVNPTHLFLGTHSDNTCDMYQKGRNRGGSRPGERNNLAKLTEEQVREIRTRYRRGSVRLVDLAADYGVTFSTIANVVNRKTWSHVP